MFRSILVFTIICLMALGTLSSGQQRYAMDASQDCWGIVPEDPSLNPPETMTGEVWVYLMNDEVPEQTVIRTDSQPGNWSFRVVNGKVVMTITLSDGSELELTGETPLPLGTWAHLAGCYGSGYGRLLLNGREEASIASILNPAEAPGPILFGGGTPAEQFNGLVDEVRLSNVIRYAEDFDPFVVPLLELRVGDQEIPGWELGTDPGDLTTAWDSLSLWNAINGAGIIYLQHNFQFWMRQYYHGQIGGHDVDLDLRMNDQGTPEDAEALYNDPLIVPPVYETIENIGNEARLYTTSLFDYELDFRRDQYFVYLKVSREWGEPEARQTILTFGAETDTNIINRFENVAALWHFNEGGGSIFSDATGHGFDGTLTNPVWAEVAFPQPVLYITSAEILEGEIQNQAIDEDDTARIAFSESVAPITIHSGNIDSILQLSNGHSWLSGAGQLGSVMWNDTEDTLEITFDSSISPPTISDGDTLTPNQNSLSSAQDHPADGYRFIRFEDFTGVDKKTISTLPRSVTLFPPHPTPFNASVCISFDIPSPSSVVLKVFDLSGREVQILHEGFMGAGRHSYVWNASNFASGIYLISLQTGATHLVKKAVLIK